MGTRQEWYLVHDQSSKALRSPDTACASPRKGLNKPARAFESLVFCATLVVSTQYCFPRIANATLV